MSKHCRPKCRTDAILPVAGGRKIVSVASWTKGGWSTSQDHATGEGKSEFFGKASRGGFNGRGRKGKKVQDLRKIQCYNCKKWGHYAVDW